jgi:uncharacterized protein involved in exopolysaccharide biosynthesis
MRDDELPVQSVDEARQNRAAAAESHIESISEPLLGTRKPRARNIITLAFFAGAAFGAVAMILLWGVHA